MKEEQVIWTTKLAAWTHDPAEKALVLFRDPLGHEKGTVQKLRSTLFPNPLSQQALQAIQKADHWASAADRPQFPRGPSDDRFAEWAQVRFDKDPVFIHPLSGEDIPVIEGFPEEPEPIKAVSLDHFQRLIGKTKDGKPDYRRTALAFWRFGPETPARELGALWGLLPADTRVPDHTIWAHLDLTSAFATAFGPDGSGTPALLVMSFGPVQDFITQSRSTSDLWAGSHLLSRIAWEGMKVVCKRLGPDTILFPQLRGVPIVDLWLLQEEGLEEKLFEDASWRKSRTDSNPLFVAALPNRFVAVVPSREAEAVAQEVTAHVRGWAIRTARLAVDELARTGGAGASSDFHAQEQIARQLEDFPEVYWATVPWSLIHENNGKIDPSSLEDSLREFYPPGTAKPGFLGSRGWQVLVEGKSHEGVFFRPNPGVLYPAIYDLLDRVSAASKTVRPFTQMPQEGYRCSLCGEREWLTAKEEDLEVPPGARKQTLWNRAGDAGESWNRKGEHLCAPCALKRLWPRLFLQEVGEDVIKGVNRYVVSTHTMALCTSLDAWLKKPQKEIPRTDWTAQVAGERTYAALPRKLDRLLSDEPEEVRQFVKALPVFLDGLREDAEGPFPDRSKQAEEVLRPVELGIKELFGSKPESYYALLLMDGDRMGAWVSGTEHLLPYERFWHAKIRASLGDRTKDGPLSRYLRTLRPPSPARHMAISGALNSFALWVVRYVVEELYKGKLLYAGGDDLLAMICIDDLLPAMQTLRYCYSGVFPDSEEGEKVRDLLGLPSDEELKIGKGHLWLRTGRKKKLLRVMGNLATVSLGAVIAHHMAPLSRVLRTLRKAERRAKEKGGRNAFAIDVIKRGGGAIELTCPWFANDSLTGPSAVETLLRLRNLMASKKMSRRAVYLAREWARDLPSEEIFLRAKASPEQFRSMIEKTLAWQFRRQAGAGAGDKAAEVAGQIVSLAMAVQGRTCREKPTDFIIDFMSVGEFLAREGRAETPTGNP